MNAIGAARSELTRWAASAVVVIGLHALGAATLLAWHDPVGWGEDSSAIVIDLTPYAPPSDSPDNISPGPLPQQAAAPAPPPQVEPKVEPEPEEIEAKLNPKVEPQQDEKVEVPPAPVPPVAAVPPPEAVEPPPVTMPEPQPSPPAATPPAPVTTAPPPPNPVSTAAANKWHKGIQTQIQIIADREAARARRETGVVDIVFSINRQGRVISSRVAHTSPYAALDQAAMGILQKAQPFEPPPAEMPGEEFSFTVPVLFGRR
jgi:protein TonB